MNAARVHHVPGRLRVRSARLKNDADAATAERLMSAISGVQQASANRITGSLTVRYDVAAVSATDLLDVLSAHDYIGAAPEPGRPLPTAPRQSGNVAVRLLSRLATMAAEKAVERTVVTLVASLI